MDTLLLVEDNEDDVFLMKRAMRNTTLSMPMQLAKDGKEALDYLKGVGKFDDRASYPMPSLIFLDLKLPYIHGLEVLRRMKQEPSLCHLNVAILSSSLEESDRQKVYALGAKGFLIKPPTPEMLTEFFRYLSGVPK